MHDRSAVPQLVSSRAPSRGGAAFRRIALPKGTLLALAVALAACGIQAHPASQPDVDNPTDTGGSGPTGGHVDNTGGGNPSGGSPSGGNPSGGQNQNTGGNSGTGGMRADAGAATGGSGNRDAGSATGGSAQTGSGGASATGAGVTINGTFYPKEKAVAFIHFGHSNMRGQATGPTSLRSYFYDTTPGLWSYKDTFTLAKEPTAPEAGTQALAGPGMAILHSAQAVASDVQFISIGYGVGSKTSVDYLKSTGTYYPKFMKWANALKGKVTFGAIVIMLGITDGEHLATNLVPDFPKRIAQIVSDIRADLGEPNLPVLFCDYEQMAKGDLAPTGSVGMVMQPLIRMLPGMVSKLVLVPTDGIAMEDDHHFNMQGHKDWANRVIMLMQSNGWFPWK